MRKIELLFLLALLLLLQTSSGQQQESEWSRQQREKRKAERKRRRERSQYDKQDHQQGYDTHDQHTNFAHGASKQFKSIFPVPRDIGEGLGNAMKSIMMGSAIGLTSIVVAPPFLAAQAGIKGFLGGALGGALFGSIAFGSSAINGVYHVIVGLIKTPRSMYEFYSRKHWDKEEREWILYDLEQDALLLKYKSETVKDLGLYDLLEVPVDATRREIKKAYYEKAKTCHPDKNPGDETAAQRFLELHAAFQTLYNDDTRSAYDKWGSKNDGHGNGATASSMFDAKIFFEILFGSQLVDPYVGALTVATFVDQLVELSGTTTLTEETFSILWDQSQTNRRKRQTEIAINLRHRIEPFVDRSTTKDAFVLSCREEADRILQTEFGEKFLKEIGSSLLMQANLHLSFRGSLFTAPVGLVRLATKKTGRLWSLVNVTRKTLGIVWDAVYAAPESRTNGRVDVSEDTIERLLPKLFEMSWTYTERDIRYTLEEACGKLFDDSGVSTAVRQQRAKAVRILGRQFLLSAKEGTASTSCHDSESLRNRLHAAFTIAQMPKSGSGSMRHDEAERIIKEHAGL